MPRDMIKHLENEIAETEKNLKNCLDEKGERTERESEKEKACEQTREKLELTKENLAEIKDVCDKGAVPGVLPKALTEKPSFKALLEELDIQAEKESPLPMGLTADLKDYSPERTLRSNPDMSEDELLKASNPGACEECLPPFSQKCLGICCDEKGGSYCDQLCKGFPNDPRCEAAPGWDIIGGAKKAWESVKTFIFGKSRSLTEEEIAEAKKIFGDKIDYEKVRIATGKGIKDLGIVGWLTARNLVPGEAATPWWSYTTYFPGYDPDKPGHPAILMHELTHIYQKDNYPSGKLGAFGAGILDAIKRLQGKESWDYDWHDLAKRPFSKFTRDQQAMIIQEYSELSVRDYEKLTSREKAKLNVIIIGLKEAGLLK